MTCFRYWLEQIKAIDDPEATKPILIVGTHADCLDASTKNNVNQEMSKLYPLIADLKKYNKTQIYGHFAISLAKGDKDVSVSSLISKLLEIALLHPRIGVGRLTVPYSFVKLKKKLEEIKQRNTQYLPWGEYLNMIASIGMIPTIIVPFSQT